MLLAEKQVGSRDAIAAGSKVFKEIVHQKGKD
jgi:hypothetical protein